MAAPHDPDRHAKSVAVDVGSAATAPSAERLLALLAASAEPVRDAPAGGELDARAAAIVAQMEQLGIDPAEARAKLEIGRDYRHDDPLCEVDRTLDRAFVPDGLSRDAVERVAPALDELVTNRVARYATRAAARARMTGDVRLATAALRAHALRLHAIGPADRRDEMVALAPAHVAATELIGGDEPLGVLAGLAPDGLRDLVCAFGARRDVTLRAFGWTELERPHGLWIVSDV